MNLTSSRYVGKAGEEYFNYQNFLSDITGPYKAGKFKKWIKPEDIVLDFGCANGKLISSLNCTCRIGVEINPAAREEAIANGVEVYSDISVILDKSITVAISHHALEHVLDPLGTLKEIHRTLVQGGRLILCLPFDDWRNQKHDDPQDINHHLFTWNPLLLGNLLREAGFEVERVWIYSYAWHNSFFKYRLHSVLPKWIFNLLCKVTAWLLIRHQVMALARKAE
jgi:SAM-dependent methyltransferase